MASSYSSKTDAILSRYRPIAPKPPLVEGPPTPENIQQSPFSKNTTSTYLPPRPCRNRRRASKSGFFPSSKNQQPQSQSFSHGYPRGEKAMTSVTLPYLPYPSSSSTFSQKPEIPQEMDLLQSLLHATPPRIFKSSGTVVISPRAVRPIGSSISVEFIQENPNCNSPTKCLAEQVEAEIELDKLPAIVSDSSNRVRLANSAYMEMVGEPECLWLDSVRSSGACKRIGGKVMLDLSDSVVPVCSLNGGGFTCRVRIEWGASDQEKRCITAHCDVMKLSCDSKDYLFTWRFHTKP